MVREGLAIGLVTAGLAAGATPAYATCAGGPDWSFEGSGPTSLIQRGITGATFEPGDTVTLMYCKMRDGRNGGHMGWAKLADGSFVNPSDGGCNGNEAMRTPGSCMDMAVCAMPRY